jgi:ATP-dependent Clp protease ATP-binding subunit ClpA
VETILDLELALLRSRLSEKDMTLDIDRKAVAFLVKQGSDDAMGARPLRRAVQRYVEDPLAELLLGESLKPGRIKGTIAKDGGHLQFKQ